MIFKMATTSDFSSIFTLISTRSISDLKLLKLWAEIRGKMEEKLDTVAILKIISLISYLSNPLAPVEKPCCIGTATPPPSPATGHFEWDWLFQFVLVDSMAYTHLLIPKTWFLEEIWFIAHLKNWCCSPTYAKFCLHTLFVTDGKCDKKFAVFWPFSLFLEDMYHTIPLVKMKIHERIIIKFKNCNLVELSL